MLLIIVEKMCNSAYFEWEHEIFSLFNRELPKRVEKHCTVSTNQLKNIEKLQILNCVINLPKLTSRQV